MSTSMQALAAMVAATGKRIVTVRVTQGQQVAMFHARPAQHINKHGRFKPGFLLTLAPYIEAGAFTVLHDPEPPHLVQ